MYQVIAPALDHLAHDTGLPDKISWVQRVAGPLDVPRSIEILGALVISRDPICHCIYLPALFPKVASKRQQKSPKGRSCCCNHQ